MSQLVMRRPHLRDLPAIPPLPEGYRLREYAGDADLPALRATLGEAFAEPWDEAKTRRELTDAADVRAIYVVDFGGAVVGTTSSRVVAARFPGAGYVHWVGVANAHLRRGLGSALMARVLHDFRERGDRDAILETDDQRGPAIATYLKYGFIPVYEVEGEDQRERWSAIFARLFARR